MRPVRPLLATVLRSTGQGNDLCWQSPNWRGFELSFEQCCGAEDCFQELGGLYSREFCCFAPDPLYRCDWDLVLDRLQSSELTQLSVFPVALQEFCCLFPGGDHPCWGDTHDALPEAFKRCCFPVLQRRLSERSEHSPFEVELARELAPLQGLRFSPADFDAFEAQESGPCRLRVRAGEVRLCNLSRSCVRDPRSGDPLWNNHDCSYVHAVRQGLLILHELRPLPDLDLFVSPTNTDHGELPMPVFTRHRGREPRGRYALLPMEWQLHPWQMRKHTVSVQREGARIPWQARSSQLIWRGSNSNCLPGCSVRLTSQARGSTEASSEASATGLWAQCLEGYHCNATWTWENWHNMPRGRLVLLSQFAEDLIDARFTGLSQPMDAELWLYLQEHGFVASKLSPMEQLRWRYALNVDGTGSGDRVYWQMLGGSLVLAQESPLVSWLLGEVRASGETAAAAALQPYEHYVPVRYDLSDLVSKLQWLRSNDAEAQRIAENGRRFAVSHLSYDAVLLYLDQIVRRYARDHLQQPWPSAT